MYKKLFLFFVAICSVSYAEDPKYLGKITKNKYDPDSISNPYGQYGSKHSPDSINNPYGKYGSKSSPESVANPYATDSPKIYSSDGKYLGKASSNQYDPESVSNPYGKYGSKYSPDSINNPYGKYGSKHSPESVTNPYATESPKVYDKSDSGYGYKATSTNNPYSSRINKTQETQKETDSPSYFSAPKIKSYSNPYATPKPNNYSNPYTPKKKHSWE